MGRLYSHSQNNQQRLVLSLGNKIENVKFVQFILDYIDAELRRRLSTYDVFLFNILQQCVFVDM